MATVTVSTDSYLDQVTYTSADQIAVSAGVTLTVRQTNATTPTGFIVYGTLLVDAFASGAVTPIILTSGANANPYNIGNAGKFIVRGGWREVGTGNGNDSQTFTDFVNGWIPYAQVETGNGTGVYTDCVCTPFAFNTHGPSTSNDLGNVFQKSGTTITFGASGTGGIKPASGAKVRVPNVHVTITGTTQKAGNATGVQNLDFENCSFGRYLYWDISGGNNIAYFRAVNVGGPRFNITSCTNFVCDGLIIQSPDSSTTSIYGISSPTGSVKRLIHLHAGSATGIVVNSTITNVTFEKCAFYNNVRTSSARDLAGPYGWYGCTFKECIFAGARLYLNTCSNMIIKDCKFSDMLTGVASTTNATSHVATNACRNLTIDGITLAANGCAARNYGIESTSDFYLTVKNWNIDCASQMLSPVYLNQTEGDMNFYNINAGTTRGSGYYVAFAVGNKYRINMKNIRGNLFQNIAMTCADLRLSGYAASGFNSAVANLDTEMAVFYANNSGGARISFTISPQSSGGYFTPVVGNPRADYSTGYVCKTNDQFIITPREKIYTISGFQNSDPTSAFPTEYSISSDRSNWGAWTSLTGANLSAETVSATDGFYIRLRITADYDGTWTGTTIEANWDNTTYYPIAFVDLKLDNLVAGSNWRISKSSDNSTIAAGTASGTSVTAPIVYSSDTPVTVRVRKAGYVPFETGGTITNTGMTTFVSQVADTVYQA